MDKYLIHEILPSPGNPRNSEGSFLRAPGGDILFAYSRFTGGAGDDESCDIALIRSSDNGMTFGEPVSEAMLDKMVARIHREVYGVK